MAMANRTAWDTASQKYIDDYDDLLAQGASGSSLNDTERELLRETLTRSPGVVHLQSGHGLDDVGLGPRPVRGSVGSGRRLQ
jgi:hypothetical protein